MTDAPVAIVTAASRGIGRACAQELARSGWRLALMSRSADVVALAESLSAIAVRGSVTADADLRRLVDATLDGYGRLDGVVVNTGHPAKGALLDVSDDEWREGLDLIVLLALRLARLATPAMRDAGGGAIVAISSYTAVEPDATRPVSSAMRAALGAVTKMYADAHAADGIRMNAVLPGFVDSYEIDEATRARIPMRRIGTLDELAKTVAFLLGPDASYITGQSIRLDGGMTRSV